MKVSVIIPAYNEQSYIAMTLDAVLAQNYPDFEVIVVDNASTDRTAEIVKRFPVRYVYESRKGLPWARETGRLEATGEIIAQVDADGRPDPNWLSRGVSYFSDPNVSGVSGPYYHYDASRLFNAVAVPVQNSIYRLFNFIFQLKFIRKGAVMIGSNIFIRASALNKAGGYNTSLTFYGEDTETAIRVSKYGRVIFSPRVMMNTSARRFKNEGFLKIEAKYIYYFFKMIFMKRNGTLDITHN